MKSFKEYTKYRNLQSLNERLFGKVNYAGKDIRVYINPTISDVGSLIMDGAMRIRGFNKGDHIFIWPEDDASHHGMSGELGNLDPDLSGKPDICFYFAVEEKNPKPPIYLKHGDIVEIEIEGVGKLTNKVEED